MATSEQKPSSLSQSNSVPNLEAQKKPAIAFISRDFRTSGNVGRDPDMPTFETMCPLSDTVPDGAGRISYSRTPIPSAFILR
jgi:hypothetical protein